MLVQAYSFTSAPTAKAPIEAHRRGVKVEVILDKSQRTEKYSSATFIFNNGIPCFIDAQHAIARSKASKPIPPPLLPARLVDNIPPPVLSGTNR